MFIGAGLHVPEVAWLWRLLLILGFLLATLPVALHLLARAAGREAGLEQAIRDAPRVGDDPSERR